MGHGKVDAIPPEDYDAGQRHYGWPITMVYQLVSRDKKHTIYEHPEAYANDAAPFSFDDAAPVNVNDKKSQVRSTYRKIDRQGMLKTYTHPTKEERARLNIHHCRLQPDEDVRTEEKDVGARDIPRAVQGAVQGK